MARSIWLSIHVLAGVIAFIFAPLALATRKGGRSHRRWGKIYFWAMAATTATAAVLVLYFGSPVFLLLVAVFSFYMALSGYRVLARKRPAAGQRARALDWIAAGAAVAGGLGLLGWAVRSYSVTGSFAVVPAVFGTISLVFAVRDIREFLIPPTAQMHWWYTHLARMIGAYIATVTAFSAVNAQFLPPVVRWLWPTVVGVPAIFIVRRFYAARFAKAPPSAEASG